MISRPRGTRDFPPKEMERRRHLENQLRLLSKQFGFGEVATPTFESEDLFVLKSGPSIIEELYAFKDRSGRKMVLRPELTAPVLRFYSSDMQFEPKPLKLFYFGNMFRYERPQSGRYREFWQFGAEIIGSTESAATAEVISLAVSMVEQSGLKNYVVRVGNVALLKALFSEHSIPEGARPAAMRALDKKDSTELRNVLSSTGMEGAGKLADILDGLLSREFSEKDMPKIKQEMSGMPLVVEALERLEETLLMSSSYGTPPIKIDPCIARGLDYYTGIVFEIDAPALGAEKQVCGGGEYALAELFGAKPAGSVGFGMGFDRLMLALDGEGYAPDVGRPMVFVVPIGKEAVNKSFVVLRTLRDAGVEADIDLMGRNPAKNMKYAETRGFRYVIILGAREIEKGIASVKDMASGEQQEVSLQDMIEFFRDADITL